MESTAIDIDISNRIGCNSFHQSLFQNFIGCYRFFEYHRDKVENEEKETFVENNVFQMNRKIETIISNTKYMGRVSRKSLKYEIRNKNIPASEKITLFSEKNMYRPLAHPWRA